MRQPVLIQFLIPAPLADKVWAACAGIYQPAQLAERVFLAWLNGAPMPRETRTAAWKLNVLKQWEAAKAKGWTTPRFIKHMHDKYGIRLERETLYHWAKKYREGGEEALKDHRIGRPPIDWTGDPFMEEMRRLRELPDHLSVRECHRRATATAAAEGWQVRGYKAADVWLRRLKRASRSAGGWPPSPLRAAF